MIRPPALVLALAAILLAGCTSTVPATPAGSSTSQPASAPATGATVSCTYTAGSQAAKQVELPSGNDVPASGTVEYVMTLNDTPLTLTLDRQKAPCTVHSFESLASQGYFDDTACHRLTTAGIFVLQCGDPSATGMGGPGYSFGDELEGIDGYPAGTLAMANAGPNTNGSQFFIVYADTQLPADYTVFGTVDAAGVETVSKLAAAGTDGSNGQAADGHPLQPAKIVSVKAA